LYAIFLALPKQQNKEQMGKLRSRR